MAYAWEDDRIQAAGRKWQEANARGDQKAMKAAEDEAKQIRDAVYGYQVNAGQANSRPTVTDGSKWTGSDPYKNYQKSIGLGTGSPYANSDRNAARQSGGSSYGAGNTYGAYGNQTNAYDDMLSNSQNFYQQALKQLEERNRIATEQGVDRLEANRGTINQGYDELTQCRNLTRISTLTLVL